MNKIYEMRSSKGSIPSKQLGMTCNIGQTHGQVTPEYSVDSSEIRRKFNEPLTTRVLKWDSLTYYIEISVVVVM